MSSALAGIRPETSIRYLFVETDYKAFMNTFECNVKRPDIVAALNCGFVFYSQWDPSLPDMVCIEEMRQ